MATRAAMVPNNVEARTMRKVRIRITPFIMVLMVIASLDRMNIRFGALTVFCDRDADACLAERNGNACSKRD
jgi:hypothetical protein